MTDLQHASVYVPITSIVKADGGRTRMVTGVAGSDRLDYDGQRASYEWLKSQLTDWFKVGNMRQDHRPGGVGKALSIDFDDKARRVTVTSKAIADDTIRLLDEGVLQGYSWGAKSVPGNPIRIRKDASGQEWIESGKVVEVSYVDSPANPDCFVQLVKSTGSGNPRRTKVLGDLEGAGVRIIQAGDPDYDAILRHLLTDIAKRDVSAAERERLGDRGHAVDTGQDHPSYPIVTAKDLQNAIQAYGRAKPEDRAKVRRHIISEAKRLNRTDMIPDEWKSVDAIAKQASCGCCDDCGPDCQGDCCDVCTMGKAAGPAAIHQAIASLAERETDTEYRAFLGKVAGAVGAWTSDPGVSVAAGDFMALGALAKAAGEPDLAKARTFYTQAQRAAVEQAMQNLHQTLGLYMEGGQAADADKDQRNNTLTGQDSPPASDQPGGPGSAPGDGVPGDGNLALDPELVRDGDPRVRTPDGQRDGGAQGEAGRNTRPAGGDAPGQGPGDQGKGAPPPGKGKATKAARKVRRLQAQLEELRKAASGASPTVALQQSLAPARKGSPKDRDKALRAELAKTTEALRSLAEKPPANAPAEVTSAIHAVVTKHERRVRKLLKRQARAERKQRADPVQQQIDELKKAVAGGQQSASPESTFLLLADLMKSSHDAIAERQELRNRALEKLVKRGERQLRKALAVHGEGLNKVQDDVRALGRLPAPGGPAIVGPQQKTFPINDSIERTLSADTVRELEVYKVLAESTDQAVAEGARQHLRRLVQTG